MTISKLILTQLSGGGIHFSTKTNDKECQAWKCSREILFICGDTLRALKRLHHEKLYSYKTIGYHMPQRQKFKIYDDPPEGYQEHYPEK
jgi:hypothetical protein